MAYCKHFTEMPDNRFLLAQNKFQMCLPCRNKGTSMQKLHLLLLFL